MRDTRATKHLTARIGLLVLGIAILIGVGSYVSWRLVRNSNTTAVTNTAQPTKSSPGANPHQIASPTTAIDDASLSSDLSGVNSSVAQESGDTDDAGAAINDQQNEVIIPTD